jgi:F-box/leucine-rich repeat protein 2/20
VPLELRPQSKGGISPFPTHSAIPEIMEDYFSLPITPVKPIRRANFDFWGEIPHEI